MSASLMGATAFQKGLGAMHSMAHVIGAKLDAHHGLINAVVMPYVLAHNRMQIEDRIERLASYMGLSSPGFTGFLDWILELRSTLEIPHTLEALGVRDEHIPSFAAASLIDPSTGSNPIAMTAKDFETLYTNALQGALT